VIASQWNNLVFVTMLASLLSLVGTRIMRVMKARGGLSAVVYQKLSFIDRIFGLFNRMDQNAKETGIELNPVKCLTTIYGAGYQSKAKRGKVPSSFIAYR
jgi:hypothetical protein